MNVDSEPFNYFSSPTNCISSTRCAIKGRFGAAYDLTVTSSSIITPLSPVPVPRWACEFYGSIVREFIYVFVCAHLSRTRPASRRIISAGALGCIPRPARAGFSTQLTGLHHDPLRCIPRFCPHLDHRYVRRPVTTMTTLSDRDRLFLPGPLDTSPSRRNAAVGSADLPCFRTKFSLGIVAVLNVCLIGVERRTCGR